jgi:hypothetical protein
LQETWRTGNHVKITSGGRTDKEGGQEQEKKNITQRRRESAEEPRVERKNSRERAQRAKTICLGN